MWLLSDRSLQIIGFHSWPVHVKFVVKSGSVRIYVGIVAPMVPRGSKILSARAVQTERLSLKQSVLLESTVMLPEKI